MTDPDKLTEEGEIDWRAQALDAMKNKGTYFAESSAEGILDNAMENHTSSVLEKLKEKVQERKESAKGHFHSETEKFKERARSCEWFLNLIEEVRT